MDSHRRAGGLRLFLSDETRASGGFLGIAVHFVEGAKEAVRRARGETRAPFYLAISFTY